MMRVKESSSDRTIETILAAVARLVVSCPLYKISIRRVAREAGCSPGTVTYYFPTIEALLEAALDDYYRDNQVLRNSLIESLQSSPHADLESRLGQISRSLYRALFARRHWLALEQLIIHRKGGLAPARREHWQGPSLDIAVNLLTPLTGLSPTAIRLAIQSIIYAAVRFATLPPEELAVVLGEPVDAQEDAPDPRVEEHFSRLAVGLLCRGHDLRS